VGNFYSIKEGSKPRRYFWGDQTVDQQVASPALGACSPPADPHFTIDRTHGVGIDFHEEPRLIPYLPPGTNPFHLTVSQEVYLTPRERVGRIRIFPPYMLLISKLLTPRGGKIGTPSGDKGAQDLLDIERLLAFDKDDQTALLGLQPAQFTSHLNAMTPESFLKLEKTAGRLWKATGRDKRFAKADDMTEWELEQMPRLRASLNDDELAKLKSDSYLHWRDAIIGIKMMFDVSFGARRLASVL